MKSQRLRRAGLLVPVWSLRTEGDLGIGDVAAMRAMVDWAAQHRVGFLQVLPINETGGDHSPYNAISSVALEPSLLDLSAVPEIPAEELQATRAEMKEEAGKKKKKKQKGNIVDYPAVKARKRELFKAGFEQFWKVGKSSSRWTEFTRFCGEESGWIANYCKFRLLMDRAGGSEAWNHWPDDFNTPEKAEEWIMELGVEAAERALAYYAWVQWIAFTQWRELREYAESKDVKLMGDIPIGISYCSADVFFEPEWFDLEWSGGAPPEENFKDDPFAVRWGQNWGIPGYRWDAMEADDFSWWRRRIDKLTDVFHIFRIDHVLGFYRIYSFPWRPQRNDEFLGLSNEEAAAKTDGRLPGFRPYPDEDDPDAPDRSAPPNPEANLAAGDRYLRMVLEAAGENEVVGEDLGKVPDYVRPHLAELGIAGFKVCQWELFWGEDGSQHPTPGDQYPECSFATYSTHDHPPLGAMWGEFRDRVRSDDEDYRNTGAHNLRMLSEFADLPVCEDPGYYPEYSDDIQWALLRALFATRSTYTALMITDLFGMTERFNIPATVGGANWRIRMPFTVAEMDADPDMRSASAYLADLIAHSER